jgi:transposase
MIYAKVDARQKTKLDAEMNSTTDAKWYRRLKVIDLSSQGFSVPELSGMFDLGAGTIRRYLHDYNEAGLDGLRPGYGQGRPPSLTWTKTKWLDLLAQSPADLPLLESGAQNWTHALLRQYLATYEQVQVTQATISKALHRAGIRWRRAKWRVHSPDPLYVVKRQRIAELQQLALSGNLTSRTAHPQSDEPPKPATLVFLDSTDLHWCPDLGSTYTPVGQQVKVDTPGLENPWLALFGSLHFPSGAGLYTVHHRKRAADLLEHLQLLIDLDAEGAFELPKRDLMLVTIVITNVLNNLSIDVDVRNINVALQVCAVISDVNALLVDDTGGSVALLTCNIQQR